MRDERFLPGQRPAAEALRRRHGRALRVRRAVAVVTLSHHAHSAAPLLLLLCAVDHRHHVQRRGLSMPPPARCSPVGPRSAVAPSPGGTTVLLFHTASGGLWTTCGYPSRGCPSRR